MGSGTMVKVLELGTHSTHGEREVDSLGLLDTFTSLLLLWAMSGTLPLRIIFGYIKRANNLQQVAKLLTQQAELPVVILWGGN